jgi:UPF0271 protein
VKLNCDLGEGYGNYHMADTAAIMPLIQQANIACGFHAGDPIEINQAVSLAVAHHVQIGAHPSYPDRQGFGRRHMRLSEAELYAFMTFQIATIQGLAARFGSRCAYVKPHGALYHDMTNDPAVRACVFQAIKDFAGEMFCLVPATLEPKVFLDTATSIGLALEFEGFADRAYAPNGQLVSRAEPEAVLAPEAALSQARAFKEQRDITAIDGTALPLRVDTLCVHSDTHGASELLHSLSALCKS